MFDAQTDFKVAIQEVSEEENENERTPAKYINDP